MRFLQLRSIFHKTLFDYRRAVFGWSFGVFLLVLMYASIYPSIGGNQDFDELLQSLPEAFKPLLGEAGFFSTPAGFINGEFFSLTFPLIIGILSIIIGSAIISKEEETGTIELLLSRPVSRSKLLCQKVLGMQLVTGFITLAGWLGMVAGRMVVDEFDVDLGRAFAVTLMVLLLGWVFGFLALLVTTLKGRGIGAGTAGVVFIVSYVVSTFAASVKWLDTIQPFSLFEYYKSDQIFLNGLNWWHVLLMALLLTACYVATHIAFTNRDVRV